VTEAGWSHPNGTVALEEHPTSFRGDIQGLRAVAVLSVVLGHAAIVGLSGGYVGVDVFFVISGFLITGVLLGGVYRGRVQLTDFFAKRAKRILPAASVVLFSSVIAAALLLNPVRATDAFLDSAWAAGFVANVKFARDGTDYFSRGEPPSILQHYWSLAVEEQFYLVWPAVLALVILLFRRRLRRDTSLPTAAITTVLLLVSATSFAFCVMETRRNPTSAYFSTPARAWELGTGALIATQARSIARLPELTRAIASWLGLACIVLAVVTFDAHTAFPGHAALLPVLGAGLVIAGGIGNPARSAALVLAQQPLRWIGDISYSLYLWHWPLLQIPQLRTGEALSLTSRLELIGLAICLSAISYYGLENPFRRARWTREPSRALLLWPASLILLLLTSAIGPTVVRPDTVSAGAPRPLPTATTDPNGEPQSSPLVAAVQQASQDAADGKAVPPALSPPLTLLRKDAYPLAGCITDDGSSEVITCSAGDLAAPRAMVLFGDSHAAMWLPALDAIGKRAHWLVRYVVKNGCSPMNVHLWYPTTGVVRDCDAWRTKAMAAIKADSAHLVLIGALMYSNFADPSGHHVLPAVVPQTWRDGVASTVADLSQSGHSVMVLGDPRPMPDLPVDCLGRGGARLIDCSARLTGDLHYTLSQETQDASRAAGGVYIDVNPWFCADQICPIVINGTIVFRDQGHVSRTYMSELADVLESTLQLPA
jgi:peptidoglycan/LPS O-acetylase OafA/YrhL